MEVKDIFRYVVEEIHTSIMATTDEDEHPVTCAIDLMDCDDDSIYFLTATGKGFYKRLICSPHIALTALKGYHAQCGGICCRRGERTWTGVTAETF